MTAVFKINERVYVKKSKNQLEGPYKIVKVNTIETENNVSHNYLVETLTEKMWVSEDNLKEYNPGNRVAYPKLTGYKGKEVNLRKRFFFTD